MRSDLECEGRVGLGALSPETSARLAGRAGSWLEFAPEEGALVVRHVQPAGCPALAGVPCELIAFLDCLTAEQRAGMPGGVLYVRDGGGQILRLLVAKGEIHIQWAREDYERAEPVALESALGSLNPQAVRVRGWARFAGDLEKAGRVQELVDRFEGLYPEGDLSLECLENTVRARFQDVNVGPRELVSVLLKIAEPAESLEADLEISSFTPGSIDRDFRLCIRAGNVRAERPALWRGE